MDKIADIQRMTNPEMSEMFGRLAVALQKLGEYEERRIKGTLFRIYTSSEINLVTENISGEWIPDGVFLEIFGTEVLLDRYGNLSISDSEASALEVYSMTDKKMLQTVQVFLKWRLIALNTLGI